MASVLTRISATVKDAWGIEASSAFYAHADDTQTLAALDTEVGAFITALDNTTDGVITAARVTLFPALPGGIKSAAVNPTAGGALVEQTGLLGFTATGTTKRYSPAIPALSNGSTVLSADRIVLTVSDPIGVLVKILTTVGTVLAWCNEHGQQIQTFIDALVSFRKKRKQLQRSSFEVS